MNIAEQIVSQLVEAGVSRIYGIVGDSLNPVVDAVRRTGGAANGGIDWIHVRHEEAAAFAAAAEAQLTGKLAVCAGSCGPGNLHLINGLYDANRSHAPVLAIASHIPTPQIGMGYFQETHPDRLFLECSVFCEMASAAEQVPRLVGSAIRHAEALRGVSVLTLPGDLADGDATQPTPPYLAVDRPTLTPGDDVVRQVATAINEASTVAIFVGAGVEDAREEVLALAERVKAPVGHSLRAKDLIQYDNPYDVGMTGLLGYGAAAEGMKGADLLILLGTDFPYDQFLPDVTTVQIDAHGEVLGRRTEVTVPVHADVAPTLAAVLPLVEAKSGTFLEKTLERHDKLMTKAVGAYTKNVEDTTPIHPEYVASILDEVAADDAVFTADTGMCNVWTARYVTPNGRRRLIGSFLHGSMANALPQAIGASLSHPGRQVISVSGDGGLSMLLGELITAAAYDLPITIVVFNNSTLGMVKLEMLVDGLPDFGVDVPGVDYAGMAAALGLHTERVDHPRGIREALTSALAHQGPALVDVRTDPMALSIPPEITGEQVLGFATAMSRLVLNRGAGEAVAMVRSNLRNIPR